MKIFAFGDIHGSKSIISRVLKNINNSKPDLILFCGDFSVFSTDLEKIMKNFSGLSAPFVAVAGNHEEPNHLMQISKKMKNFVFLHNKAYKFRDYLIVGVGGGGFSERDIKFDKFIERIENSLEKEKKIIFISHAPPYGTKLDLLPMFGHVGCKSYREFIKNFTPKLAFSGHIHETFDKNDKLKETLMINPGPFGKIFEIE